MSFLQKRVGERGKLEEQRSQREGSVALESGVATERLRPAFAEQLRAFEEPSTLVLLHKPREGLIFASAATHHKLTSERT
jgi:hypothetical protein